MASHVSPRAQYPLNPLCEVGFVPFLEFNLHRHASVEPEGQGTTQDVAAFKSDDGKFRTRMDKAGPEHQEYKSGYESNEFISWFACQVD